MIQALIFDLGGVLVRTEDPGPRTELATRYGLTRSELESHVFNSPSGLAAQRGQIDAERHWENIQAVLDIPAPEMRAFRAAFWGGDRLDYELVATIRSLRGQYRTALLSNAFSDLRHYLTGVWKIDDAFDHLIISAEVGLVKPDPTIYRITLQRLGVAPSEAVFMDDFRENVAGARAVGLHAIHFQGAEQAISELTSLLDRRGST